MDRKRTMEVGDICNFKTWPDKIKQLSKQTFKPFAIDDLLILHTFNDYWAFVETLKCQINIRMSLCLAKMPYQNFNCDNGQVNFGSLSSFSDSAQST